jgi:hypothetical protein
MMILFHEENRKKKLVADLQSSRHGNGTNKREREE